ncbi:hypothetical protein IAW_05011 [Bacillus cereus str. Schrouff]|uniref:AAA family ATPase n=1 Tax=Bacillus cereus TaxID=1396 RepID=UPI00033057B9|nr:AAA family ATPase [Bacillus cereus]EOO05702.1 hypothetical protein IAW_05011 [Bacillus cereus str. Schrouff]EOO81844.1 hypothetical protein IGY_05555 [Bacillus cereus K-5975c]MCU4896390.1 AAA family ATPase [Bacillus cereus]
MLKYFEIYNLHDIQDNNIVVRFNDDLTLLVGKNGAGKTTTLNILNIILSKRFEKLFTYKFERIVLGTGDGILTIKKDEDSLNFELGSLNESKHMSKLKISKKKYFYEFDGNRRLSFEYEGELESFAKQIEVKYFPTYRRVESDIFNLLVNNANDYGENSDYYNEKVNDVLEKLSKGSDQSTNNIILGVSDNDIKLMIKRQWEEVTRFEKENLNNLVRNFMLSLLKAPSSTDDSPALDYLHKTFKADEVREKLKQFFTMVGFISEDNTSEIKLITEHVQKVDQALKKFFNTDDSFVVGEALDVLISYNQIHRLLEMFEETHKIIMEKKQPFYELVRTLEEFIDVDIDFHEGIISFSKNEIDLNYGDLSAGEKQLVTLFVYSKLCNEEKTIILIDEPELSLHISWQRKFLKYLINKNENVQFVISSHSPFIVSNHKGSIELLAPMGVEE